ncbi:MAG: hypothetical protein ACRDKI_05400 [Solirubrobacterales bacterium]
MAFGRKKDSEEVVIDAQIEESATAGEPETMPVPRSAAVPEASGVRALATKNERELAVRQVAVATAGGVVAGAATIAVAAVAKNIAKPAPGLARRRRKDVVASRSFMVDVHLLKSQR